MPEDQKLLNDRDVARCFAMSASWVRGQRYKRRHNLPHHLTVDPRYIGTSPRYIREEIDAFIRAIAA